MRCGRIEWASRAIRRCVQLDRSLPSQRDPPPLSYNVATSSVSPLPPFIPLHYNRPHSSPSDNETRRNGTWKKSRATSYVTVLGLAAKSLRYQSSMEAKLILMVESAARASDLDGVSVRDRSEAAELEGKAAADTDEAAELQEMASDLLEEAEEDEARAAADTAEGGTLSYRAAELEAEAGEHLARAAEDGTVLATDEAESAFEALEAAELEAEALEDASLVVICEMIPFLDVLCDVVGAMAEIGSESAAAALSAESTAEIVSAALAASDEEVETTEAAELQARAATDEGEAADLEGRAEDEEIRADLERAEAGEDEAAAEAKFKQSTEERSKAAEDAGRADAEAGGASESWEDSIAHGLGALWDAVLSAALSVFSLFYFALRLLLRFIIPGARALAFERIPDLVNIGAQEGLFALGAKIWRSDLSHVVLHCSIFAVTLGTFSEQLKTLSDQSVRSRGGVVISFACLAGAMHSMVHHIPRHFALAKRGKSAPGTESDGLKVPTTSARTTGSVALRFSVSFLTSFVFLASLFAMEFLIVRICFGPDVFDELFVSGPSLPPFLWTVCILSAWAHVRTFWPNDPMNRSATGERCVATGRISGAPPTRSSNSKVLTLDEWDEGMSNELDALLRDLPSANLTLFTDTHLKRDCGGRSGGEESDLDFSDSSDNAARYGCTETADRAHRVRHLQLPFEVLVVSCTIALLRTCVPKFNQLLPVLSSNITASGHVWYIAAAILCFISIFIVFFRCSHAPAE